jgi:alpha-L-rhamnosidase
MRKRGLFCLAIAVLWANDGIVSAQVTAEHESEIWAAQWITAKRAPERDEVVLHFRKIIDIRPPTRRFIVQVSADNQFIFFANGQRIGSGPSRSDCAHWRYETFDLAPFLHSGKNVLAATVWNFGTRAAIAQMSDRVGLIVHGNEDTERVADTNSTWDVEQEKGIETLRPHLPGFYYAAEPGERLDARKFDWSSTRDPSGHEGAWGKAASLGRGAKRGERDGPNNWQLTPDPLPPMEMTPISSGTVVRATGIATPAGFPEKGFTVPPHTKASILLDRSQLTTGYPALTVSGGLGSVIRLTYAEALFDDAGRKGNRNEIEGKHILGLADEFLPNGTSSLEFMPLSWRCWRYLQLDVKTDRYPVEINSLRTWFTAFPFLEKANFRSDDPSLAPIWDIGWRTARLDAHDTYMDTPYWERLQYIGDTRIQALISYVVAGDDRLARQAIQAFNDSRIPDGLTQSRYPSSLTQMIPTFSLLWVGMVHDFWMYRGDPEFVRAQVPGTRTVLDWFLHRQRADGLLGRLPWWPFVDWGKDFADGEPPQDEDGGSAVLTLQFVEALLYAAELEAVYGDPHVADTYREAAVRASQAIGKLCWNEHYGLVADTPAQKHFSQHANILAVWLDVIPRKRGQEILAKILSASDPGYKPDDAARSLTTAKSYDSVLSESGHGPAMTNATYYFRFYLARALEHVGMAETYLQLLGPWREMVSRGLTTWAESPEPTRSDSHAWSAHPNYDFLTVVAGIRPKTAGFRTVVIEPHLGPLNSVQAALPTPNGLVEVKYTRVSNGIEAQVLVPAGVSGDLLWHGHEFPLHPGLQKFGLP